MAISQDILSSTLADLLKRWVDATYQSHPFLDLFRKLPGAQEKRPGGAIFKVPVALHEHSTTVVLKTGYENRPTVVQDVLEDATYDMVLAARPVLLTLKDELDNKGDEAKVQVLDVRTKTTVQALTREVEAAMLRYDPANPFAGELETLDGVTAASTHGFLEEDAVGSQTNTVGGLVKGAYGGIWQNQVEDVGSAFATNGRTAINALNIETANYKTGPSNGVLVLSTAAATLYLNTLQDQIRFADASKLDLGGFAGVNNQGNPVISSPTLGFAVGANAVSGYLIDMGGGIRLRYDPAAFFTLGDKIQSSSQILFSMDVLFRAQLFADLLRSSGVLLNAES